MATTIDCKVFVGGAATIAYPYVLLKGLGAVIGELAALIAYMEKKNEIIIKQNGIDDLEQQLQTIEAAQVSLDAISRTDVSNMLSQLKMSECELVIRWIENGEKKTLSDILRSFLRSHQRS
ncbi:hypothetical protein PILCRDRAFT_5203 [Piloderma croceum F 1598]|uniref:Uncharacterized protein n=1 Tax=Piloderma croceum (strain F 1598) TaxID=765440 RepID=A0A0C3G2S6_PILCF|nr:hypothetical protein PILCRDRAFT_5203 [Piloderma croceum F 1598]